MGKKRKRYDAPFDDVVHETEIADVLFCSRLLGARQGQP
jgi:hypothetical protein